MPSQICVQAGLTAIPPPRPLIAGLGQKPLPRRQEPLPPAAGQELLEPAGIPVGGQFASKSAAEADLCQVMTARRV